MSSEVEFLNRGFVTVGLTAALFKEGIVGFQVTIKPSEVYPSRLHYQ